MTTELSSKRPTASDVARIAGVSRATVGYVVNRTSGVTISAATRERVLAAAGQLGYRPHMRAQALARGRSNVVVLELPDWPQDYSLRRNIEEAERTLDAAGYTLVAHARRETGSSHPFFELLDPDLVLGYVRFTRDEEEAFRRAGISHVRSLLPEDPESDSGVNVSVELQVTHLVERGHSSLAYAASADRRLRGLSVIRQKVAHRTALDLGVSLHDSQKISIDDATSASAAIARWRSAGITGVVAYNDDVAAAIVQASLALDLAVPGDLAVIGNDNSPMSRLYTPGISSVETLTDGLGAFLASFVLASLEGTPLPEAPAVSARLSARSTT